MIEQEYLSKTSLPGQAAAAQGIVLRLADEVGRGLGFFARLGFGLRLMCKLLKAQGAARRAEPPMGEVAGLSAHLRRDIGLAPRYDRPEPRHWHPPPLL